MESDTDAGEEVIFTADGATSGEESATNSLHARKKQLTVTDFVRRGEARKAKRNAPGESFNSPPNEIQPDAKRRSMAPSPAAPVGLNAETMEAIKQMVEGATAKVIVAFNSKFEALERRVEIVEAENMDKAAEIAQLKTKLQEESAKVQSLQDQVESMDMNRRLSSLIVSCADFKHRDNNEVMEERVVDTLNKRVPELNLSVSDVNIAHRLRSDDRVIVKFVRRSIRDRVYESRFSLPRADSGVPNGRKMAPLYIAECLTTSNNNIFQELLRARRQENGAVIASVFSRRGTVWCKKEKGGPNIRVPDEAHLVRVLNGKRFPPAISPKPAAFRTRPAVTASATKAATTRSHPKAPTAGHFGDVQSSADRVNRSGSREFRA